MKSRSILDSPELFLNEVKSFRLLEKVGFEWAVLEAAWNRSFKKYRATLEKRAQLTVDTTGAAPLPIARTEIVERIAISVDSELCEP
jgi:hypothetical protein